MKRIKLMRQLQAHGCVLKREGAEHSIFLNPVSCQQSAVPRHREKRERLAKLICQQLGVSRPA